MTVCKPFPEGAVVRNCLKPSERPASVDDLVAKALPRKASMVIHPLLPKPSYEAMWISDHMPKPSSLRSCGSLRSHAEKPSFGGHAVIRDACNSTNQPHQVVADKALSLEAMLVSKDDACSKSSLPFTRAGGGNKVLLVAGNALQRRQRPTCRGGKPSAAAVRAAR